MQGLESVRQSCTESKSPMKVLQTPIETDVLILSGLMRLLLGLVEVAALCLDPWSNTEIAFGVDEALTP